MPIGQCVWLLLLLQEHRDEFEAVVLLLGSCNVYWTEAVAVNFSLVVILTLENI